MQHHELCRAKPDLVFEPFDEGILVHDPGRGKVHVLNRGAAAVLQACNGAHAREELAAVLAAGETVAHERLEADLNRILAEFETLGLISNPRLIL